MIDFNTINKEKIATVPIVRGCFQYNRKKYREPTQSTGWYRVFLKNNDALITEEIIIESEDMPNTIKGYVFNNNLIFHNFDVGKRKLDRDVMMPLCLNNAPTFSPIHAIIWEDKHIYYYKPDYSEYLVYDVKNRFDSSQNISDLKGITPELKHLFLFHDIERQKLREELEKIKKEEERQEFLKSTPGRLQLAFSRVGATMLNYSITRNRIIVDWKLESGQKFNSVIDANTFRVIEAGYCLSGEDRKHSVSSMVLLASDYEKDDLIHITRHD